MKKLMSLTLVAVLALSFVAGIMVSRADAVEELCWKASACSVHPERVKVCCLEYNNAGDQVEKCYWDTDYYYWMWCGWL